MSRDSINAKQDLTDWSLKLQDPVISFENPWEDDALERKEVAKALTNLISKEPNSLVISLSGNWGTGKTFLLKRWQVELEREGFKSIYFNAWKDDFCDESLIAIIGQLADFLKKNKFHAIKNKIVKSAGLLVKQNIMNILYKQTGLKTELENLDDQFLTEYKKQRETKDKLKGALKEISTKIVEQTNHPLIFIIDELDRCRPTFSVELLERVKHIFDIPYMIFVFGINRSELCSSIKSIYGKIDSTVYLRRFFDMEFTLPTANARGFCEYTINKYNAASLFEKLSKIYDNEANDAYDSGFTLEGKYMSFQEFFPIFRSYFDLSLRDIDYCVRSVLFIGKTIAEEDDMYPLLVSAILILRLKDEKLYLEFIQGKRLGSEIMDYIDKFVLKYDTSNKFIDSMHELEVNMYSIENNGRMPFKQLELILEDKNPTHPEYLSKRTRELGKKKVALLQRVVDTKVRYIPSIRNISLSYISNLIELAESVVKK